MPGFSGMERISSAPRLSFSTQDIFNLRNHNLQLSRSTPGICTQQRNWSEQRINLLPGSPPKGILVKPKEESIQELAVEEKEEKKSDYDLRLELQFTAFVFLCFILGVFIPISMIVVGSSYVYSCPAQVMIPIFLIVGGTLFLATIFLFRKLNKLSSVSDSNEMCYKKFQLATVLFHIGWFIAGCYWIYSAYEPNYTDEDNPLYCHKTLYFFAFWLINSIFLAVALFTILFTIYIVFGREAHIDIEPKDQLF